MFDYKFETINETLIITIKGTFDTIGAQKIQDEFKNTAFTNISKIIFDLSETDFMASSGLRVLFYAKTKIKENIIVKVYTEKELVIKLIKMSGMSKFISLKESPYAG